MSSGEIKAPPLKCSCLTNASQNRFQLGILHNKKSLNAQSLEIGVVDSVI